MKQHKVIDLKSRDDADTLVQHLNEGWDIFREFTGWVILCKDKEVVVSPPLAAAAPKLPREWFETLKEPLRSQALEALDKFPDSDLGGFRFDGFDWDASIQGGMYWDGAEDFFTGASPQYANRIYLYGYEMARQCAPDGWGAANGGESKPC